jgi:hypothetical protein
VKLGDSNSECLGKLGSVQTNQLALVFNLFHHLERQQFADGGQKEEKNCIILWFAEICIHIWAMLFSVSFLGSRLFDCERNCYSSFNFLCL